MPVKLRRAKGRSHRITDEAVEAYIARDVSRLHRALGLRPWEVSPLRRSVTALGVDQGAAPPGGGSPWLESWPQAQELQRQLEAAVRERKGR